MDAEHFVKPQAADHLRCSKQTWLLNFVHVPYSSPSSRYPEIPQFVRRCFLIHCLACYSSTRPFARHAFVLAQHNKLIPVTCTSFRFHLRSPLICAPALVTLPATAFRISAQQSFVRLQHSHFVSHWKPRL